MVSWLEERDVGMFKKYKVGLILVLFLNVIHLLSGASLALPESMRPGEMFVVSLQSETADEKIVLQFDAAHLQFLGAAQATPDIQIKSDTEIEIKPVSDKPGAAYDLRFLPLSTGSTMLKMQHSAGIGEFAVVFTPEEISRGYSWVILLVAVILLVVGIKIWRYQKSSPEMMSTKSLFMNYEELEKARKLYGHDFQPAEGGESENARQSDSGDSADKSSADSVGKKTLKHAAVKVPQSADMSPLLSAGESIPEKPATEKLAAEDSPAVAPAEVPCVAPEPEPSADEKPKSESPAAAQKTMKKKAVHVPVLSDDRLARADVTVEKKSEPVVEKPEPKKVSPLAQQAIVLPSSADDGKKQESDNIVPPTAETQPEEPQTVSNERFVFSLEGNNRAYEAQGNVIRIGRRKENQICITASEISREHVELTASKGIVFVRPLTETNTTRLNGRLVKDRQVIKPGDTLNLGGTDFIVVKARPI